MFPCYYVDMAGRFWQSFGGRQHGHWVFIPQGFHICFHPRMCCGEWLKANWEAAANCTTPDTYPQGEPGREGVVVANPDSSVWVLDLCLWKRKRAEGDPVQKESIWQGFGGSLADHFLVGLVMFTSPPCIGSGQHHCSHVQLTLIGPTQHLYSLWAEPGSSPPAHREMSSYGGERTGNGAHCCPLHTPELLWLPEGIVFSTISRSFRCSLETVR